LVVETDSFLSSPWVSNEVSLFAFVIDFGATELAVRARGDVDSERVVFAGGTDNFMLSPPGIQEVR